MKRKLLAVGALCSLVFCLCTVWWWVGSSRRMTQVTFRVGAASVTQLWGCAGKLALVRSSSASSAESSGGQILWNSVPFEKESDAPHVPGLKWTSFAYTSQPATDHAAAQSALVLPAWLIAGLFAFLPAVWVVEKRKGAHSK